MEISTGIRKVLGLTALAAFGALELALVCTAVGFLIEMVFGVDLPLINWVAADGRAS